MIPKRLRGFTLIELMVVVVIVGILASIAYPSYTNFMRQARRSDAHVALLKLAAEQEKFMSDCTRYADFVNVARSCITLGLGHSDNKSPDGNYQLTVATTGSGATFTATATPVAGKPQAADTDCPSFSINELGNKAPATCWKK